MDIPVVAVGHGEAFSSTIMPWGFPTVTAAREQFMRGNAVLPSYHGKDGTSRVRTGRSLPYRECMLSPEDRLASSTKTERVPDEARKG